MSDETQVIDILKETCRNLNAGKIVFSRFELEREIGKGGMGVVWLARDRNLDKSVALKFLPGLVRDPVAERDLLDEVRNASDLRHDNIVNVRTLHKDEASIAVEMEYVDGPSISRLIAESTDCWLQPEQAAPIVRGLCLAIDYAWQRKLVHRDIKPLNLLLSSTGIVKVVDFGIAHSVSETIARLTNVSANKRVVGSLPYMSPQQLKGEILHLNDVYGIGATIYELLTGTPPFRAKDVATLTSQINHDVPPGMAERRRQLIAEKNRKVSESIALPKGWEEVVAACLAKAAAKRPQSAREIAVRLGLVADHGTVAPFSASHGSPPRASRRRKWLLPAFSTAAVIVLGAAGWTFRDRFFPATEKKVPEPIVQPQELTVTDPQSKGDPAKPKDEVKAVESPKSAEAGKAVVVEAPRASWNLTARTPTRVTVSDDGGKVLHEKQLKEGEKLELPVDKSLLVEVKEGTGLQLEIDGKVADAPAVTSKRWLMTIPSARTAAMALREAPLPFEAEVGPLVKRGEVNRAEADWVRAALGGEKGDDERSLVQRLFTKGSAITLSQWRARTKMEFKLEVAALTSNDRAVLARAVDLVLAPGTATMRLIRIEPGEFIRGAPGNEIGRRPSDLASARAKILQPFFIGKFEVTHSQFDSVLRRNPSYWREGGRNPTLPVDQVTWSDLVASNGFITTLNATLAKMFNGVIIADLPTDDEWEYACRAGETTAFNNGKDIKFNDSDPSLAEIAHYNKMNGKPIAVGSLAPNAWGLHDMHGNLQEWTKDRTVRGGSFQSTAAGCRAASRSQMSAEAESSNQTGFRLVLRIRNPAPAR